MAGWRFEVLLLHSCCLLLEREIESTRTGEIIRALERSCSCGERGGFVWKVHVFLWFMSE
jgi:hypothetical protein